MKICSACLLGIECRYNGQSKPNEKVIRLSKKEVLIPVCPEQLGGSPTPREPAEQIGKKVVTKSGTDITDKYTKGAEEVLKIAELYGISEAILYRPSPSCGSGRIYDGSFTRKTISGDGVTAALLKKSRIKVITEEDL